LQEQLVRAHVAGRGAQPGPSEIRRLVERAVEQEPGVLLDDAWIDVESVFGATIASPVIDPDRTIGAARGAVRHIVDVASTGAPIAFATSRPASLLTFYLALARLARISGGDVIDDDDSGPIRVDGRAARAIRWVDGVAMVTDGESLCGTRGLEAPQEWLFLMHRPALVIADGPYADAALDAGLDVVALGGLEHCSLVVGRRAPRCLVVPLWTDRGPAAYRPLIEAALAAAVEPPDVADPSTTGADPSANGAG
jgi:histidinol phosphate phosphatase hisN-like protein